MKRYSLTLTGESPLLMHSDNITFCEELEAWRKAPENKKLSKAGDDRTPAWTWVGYTYHDGREIGIPADNLMTMLKEGGAKVTRSGRSTYKKETQAMIMADQMQFQLLLDGKPVPIGPFLDLIGERSFVTHLDRAKEHGFELFVKRARVGQRKHIRVRPLFRDWVAVGSITVIDEEASGLTQSVIQTILDQAGAFVGLCDWRPGSGSPGQFGRFSTELIALQ